MTQDQVHLLMNSLNKRKENEFVQEAALHDKKYKPKDEIPDDFEQMEDEELEEHMNVAKQMLKGA